MMDVARLAEVSHQTVSRVLNSPDDVRPTTRERVLEAIDTLGYRRNSAARALVTGRSDTIGIVSFNGTLFGPASSIDSIEKAASQAGYAVTIAAIHDISQRSVTTAVERLLAQGVDGVMVVAPFPLTIPHHVPAVLLHGGPEPGLPSVSVDQELGARLATEHLLAQGHATVWHVAGPDEWTESSRRTAGWQGALSDAGVDLPEPLPGDWSARSGYEAGLRLCKVRSVSAVFVANDHMALGVLRAFAESRRRVPDDVCVVGFDDIPEAAFLTPSLSSVRQDFAEVGRRSVALMLAQIDEGNRGPASISVEPELVIRQSSTPSNGRTSLSA
jgi:DNA-binding LacI/PurR family transcriptional regulator